MLQIQSVINPQNNQLKLHAFRTFRNIFHRISFLNKIPPSNLCFPAPVLLRTNVIISTINNQYQFSPSFTTTTRFRYQNFKKFQNFSKFQHWTKCLHWPKNTYNSTCLSCNYTFNTYTLSSSPHEDSRQQKKDPLHYMPPTL